MNQRESNISDEINKHSVMITCSDPCAVMCVSLPSQGHPVLGIRSSGSLPRKELWNHHLPLGGPYGGSVTLC